MHLINFDGNRRNNFTIIRLVLAWMVIVSHAFTLQKSQEIGYPLYALFQGSASAGQLAVDGFFAISGFLVTASLIKRGVLDYSLSRALRIFPALFFCIAASVFVLGPLLTNLNLEQYFSHSATFNYLYNALAFPATRYTLPGVFTDNPTNGFNGSLWSISYEVKCYAVLASLGILGIFKRYYLAQLIALSMLAVLLYSYIDESFLKRPAHIQSALTSFALGVVMYLNRERIILDWRLAGLAAIVIFFSFGEPWFRYTYAFSWAYLLFYMAYMTPYVDLDSKLGDISYGIYIYAFPVQQIVTMLTPSGNGYTNIVFTTLAVVPLAYFSWHWLEEPALKVKRKLIGL